MKFFDKDSISWFALLCLYAVFFFIGNHAQAQESTCAAAVNASFDREKILAEMARLHAKLPTASNPRVIYKMLQAKAIEAQKAGLDISDFEAVTSRQEMPQEIPASTTEQQEEDLFTTLGEWTKGDFWQYRANDAVFTENSIQPVHYSENGKFSIEATTNQVGVRNFQTGQAVVLDAKSARGSATLNIDGTKGAFIREKFTLLGGLDRENGAVHVFDTSTGATLGIIPAKLGYKTDLVRFTQDPNQVLVVRNPWKNTADGFFEFVNFKTGKVTSSWSKKNWRVASFSSHSMGKFSHHDHHGIQIYDTFTVRHLPAPAKGILTQAISNDGSMLATGGVDGEILIWNTDGTGIPVSLLGANKLIRQVGFNDSGTLLFALEVKDLKARLKLLHIWQVNNPSFPVFSTDVDWDTLASFIPGSDSLTVYNQPKHSFQVWNPGEMR